MEYCKNKTIKEGREREGGDDRNPALKNVSAMMPAAESRYW
jgi:hypothetical protein